jgi:diguanylate cyclase (GGDEF)-like protein
MDPSARRTHARKLWWSRAPRNWALALLMVLVAAVAGGSVFAIEHLRSSAENAQRREVSDLKLSTSVQELGALEWQAVAESGLSPGDAADAFSLIDSVERLARGAADYGDIDGRLLVTTAERYRTAARHEFALLRAGDLEQAHQVDEHLTDPTADALKNLLGTAIAKAERIADQQSRTAGSLTLVIALVGGLLTLGLLWRVERGLDATRRAASLSRQAARLGREASRDQLTGLPNRRQLLRDLEDVLEAQQPAALALIDLNGFKSYNDTFGHIQGDLLLERFGEKLAVAVDGDRAYRLGGDEFCVLLPDDERLSPSLNKVRDALAEQGDSFIVTASYGVVYLPAEASDATDALRVADGRMYQNKRAGRTSTFSQTSDLARSVITEHALGLHQHSNGVAVMAEAIGTELGLDQHQLADLRGVADLHDIGKVGIPQSILDDPGRLSKQEWRFIHEHTLVGERILASAPALASIARLVRSTHERYDGTGYPDRLTGEDIPLLSRIVFVCDSWDAMTKGWRPYQTQLTSERAQAELRKCAGTQFDPAIVDAALTVIRSRLQDPDQPHSRHLPTEVHAI